jgi:hypothetical protein
MTMKMCSSNLPDPIPPHKTKGQFESTEEEFQQGEGTNWSRK